MPTVVVVGGGMAGVACARELGRNDVEVVLVDRNDYLQFQPLLYQVASSQLPAEDVARPLRVVLEDLPSVTVKQMDVATIDLATRTVTGQDGTGVAGDYLVLAAGAQPALSGFEPSVALMAFSAALLFRWLASPTWFVSEPIR